MQAESELTDEAKREELDAVIKQARVSLLKGMNLPISVTDDDPRLRELSPPWKQQLRSTSKDMLIEEEVRRRKYVTAVLTLYGLHAERIHSGL